MKDKPLLIRFGVLVVIVALAVLAVIVKPFKMGMDLAGGHSLEFKVNTDKAWERDEVIDTLKERVDPQNLMNLEWRPTGDDRFEVRMPAGSKKARKAKSDYLAALEDLAEWNVTPAYTRRVVAAQGEERDKLIDQKLGLTTERGRLLLAACNLYDEMNRKLAAVEPELAPLRKSLAALEGRGASWEDRKPIQEKIDALTGPAEEDRGNYRNKIRDLRAMNLQTRDLTGVLSLYVSKRVASEMKPDDVKERQDDLAKQLERIRAAYPEIKDKIDNVVSLYKDWAESRGRLDDPQDLIRLIRRAGVLEYRIAPRPAGSDGPLRLSEDTIKTYVENLRTYGAEGRPGDDYRWFPVKDPKESYAGMITTEWAGKRYLLLSDMPASTMLQSRTDEQWKLTNARATTDRKMMPAVGFDFDQRGSALFGTLTGAHKGEFMAILLDDEVYSAPVIRDRILGQGIITGRFTREEVQDLVRTLKAGSLRAKVNPNPITVNSIGPTLGQANIIRGKRAAVIGLICVVAFMAVYFLLAGMIANFALAMNVLLVLAVMAVSGAVFTLPGIAGLILTMGIAVDANVLIFERLREEQAKGQPMVLAIQNAYNRAFSAIIDGNITTLLTCVILAWVGSTEIRGFGITLGIGIVISLFTALLVTRWIFRLLVETGLLKNKVLMLRLVGVPNVNWIGKRRLFWALSGVLIVLGVASLIGQGANVMGIEFRQGARAVVRFNDDAMIDGKLLDDSLVEQRLKATGAKLNDEKMTGQDVQVNVLTTETRVADFIQAYDANNDGAADASEWAARERAPAAFEKLDANADGKLTADELDKTLPEPRYQITTAQSDPAKVREVIDEAFQGLLSVQSKLDAKLITGDAFVDAKDLRVRIPATPGYVQLRQSDFRSLGDKGLSDTYNDILQDYVGGMLMAFRLENPEQAMTVQDLKQRLRNVRLQAGRDTVYVIEQDILPLTPLAGSKDRYMSFAVAMRTDEIEPDDEKWERFAETQKDVLTGTLTSEQSLESFRTIDSTMSKTAIARAVLAILLSWLVIIAYLWFRFGSAQWGVAAVICLVHDTLVVLGLVGMCYWLAGTFFGNILMIDALKIDPVVIAAVLTVIGYSVNDTIVVFDRIRENRGKLTKVSGPMINRSVNQTLSRTILTSTTTLLVVVVMYVWGGEGIHGFSFALLAGVIFGTYSSVAIASPLLMGFKRALVAKVTAGPAPTDQTP